MIKLPTQIVELPSKGKVYSEQSVLSKGVVELKYPDTTHQDILTTQQYIQKGIVVDEFLKALIVTDGVDYDTLVIGDKNALMIAARIMLYGKNYTVQKLACSECDGINHEVDLDLTQISDKEIDLTKLNQENSYVINFEPHPQFPLLSITYSLTTVMDEKIVRNKINAIKKIDPKRVVDNEVTFRIKQMIKKIVYKDGDKVVDVTKHDDINNFTLPVHYAELLKKDVAKLTPDINRTVTYTCQHCQELNKIALPITTEFFWPNARG